MSRKNTDARHQTPDSRLSMHGGHVYAFAQARGVQPEQVLDFSASINPLGWSRGVATAYRRALNRVVHYPELYAETLTTELAQYHGLDPAAILVGNGSTQLIYLLARVIAPRQVLVVAPLFSEHETAFRLAGTQVTRFFLRPPTFALAIDKLQSALTAGYDALVLTNPNSPTGALIPRTAMTEIARLCRQLRVQLVVDETFVDWVEEESLKYLATQNTSVIVLRSLTKFFAVPGLRVGYVIAHPTLISRLRKYIEPWSVNSVAQEMAIPCVRDQSFIEHSRTFIARERTWLANRLTAIPGLQVFPSAANFLLLRVTARGLDARTFRQRGEEALILVRECSNFAGLGKQFFRVAIRTRREHQQLLALCEAVFSKGEEKRH